MIQAFNCSGCDSDFDWVTELPVIGVYEIKTIGSRYCHGCIDKEAAAHGISVEHVIDMRRRLGRVVP